MRILIIHNYYQDRGGEDIVFEQESARLSQNHQVKTITFKNQKGIKGLFQFLSYPYNIYEARKIRCLIKEFQPDIAHIHNIHYSIGPIVFKSLKRANIPTVYSLHNYRLLDPSASLFFKEEIYTDTLKADFPWKSVRLKVLDNSMIKTFVTAFTYWLHKKLKTWKQVDTYLVFSTFMKKLILSSSINITEQQIRIKPNFVLEDTSIETCLREDHFVFVGRLDTQKGISTLLKAFANSTHKLKIFGTGPLENLVKEYAENHTNIIFGGFQQKERINQELATCQAMIITSISYEGMPMTVLEAMSLGTPVLASDIGILSEMISNNYNGYKFKTKNSEDLKNVLNIWQNISEENKIIISANCKKEFKEKYNAEQNIALLEAIYTETIEKSKHE